MVSVQISASRRYMTTSATITMVARKPPSEVGPKDSARVSTGRGGQKSTPRNQTTRVRHASAKE
eukprot:2304085-Prorocentrum_lima.AAC.1